jgi:hypothetical protein
MKHAGRCWRGLWWIRLRGSSENIVEVRHSSSWTQLGSRVSIMLSNCRSWLLADDIHTSQVRSLLLMSIYQSYWKFAYSAAAYYARGFDLVAGEEAFERWQTIQPRITLEGLAQWLARKLSKGNETNAYYARGFGACWRIGVESWQTGQTRIKLEGLEFSKHRS